MKSKLNISSDDAEIDLSEPDNEKEQPKKTNIKTAAKSNPPELKTHKKTEGKKEESKQIASISIKGSGKVDNSSKKIDKKQDIYLGASSEQAKKEKKTSRM